MFKSSLAALPLLAAAAVQMVAGQAGSSSSDLSTGIATVLLNLEGAHVIPDLLAASAFDLSALLTQTFGSTSNSPGQMLSIQQVASEPTWSLQYGPTGIEDMTFTVMTLDPGAATATPGNVVRHFLGNNMTLSNGELSNSTASVAGWFSPAPPAGDGVHRYTTLVFEQKSTDIPASLAQRDETIDTDFNVAQYISQANLGSLIAATFFLCENSTAATTSVSPEATSSVSPSMISSAAASISTSLSSAGALGTSTDTISSASSSGASGSSSFVGAAAVVLACTFAGAAILL